MGTGSCRRSPACPTTSSATSSTATAGLQQILRASVEDLDTVEGIEVAGAHFVKEGLARLAETSILDRLG